MQTQATTDQRGQECGSDFPIAFVGTYPPRRCGLAMFTRDLSDSVSGVDTSVVTTILTVTEAAGEYEDHDQVRFEIRRGVKGDYVRAADFINHSNIQLVSVQHEYGIFGGPDGAYILDLLARLRVPAIATLHTILKTPTKSQCAIVQKMAERCERLVVMSNLAFDLLDKSYGVAREKVQMIPHGIPDMPYGQQEANKARLGMSGRRMLLTFGLLSPNKGIESAVRALPKLVARFPDVVYFVVGATHPEIKRRVGEQYRNTLEREADALGLRDHIVFRDRFVSHEELGHYLQAADIYLTPFLNEAQITSGTLSYAMGAGTAVVSTPYWHAQELLADGRGRLFPFGDADALAHTVESLLADESKLEQVRRAAYEFTRAMTWPRVGEAYVGLARRVLEQASAPVSGPRPVRATSLPELRLEHLLRMTDDTGIIQHSTYSIPARRTGYCVDDNARALLVALLAHRVSGAAETKRLITTYLSYLHYSQAEDGHFHNFMDYHRTLDPAVGSEDCVGRALWALGTCVRMAPEQGARLLAKEMFHRALPLSLEFGLRGRALAILGLEMYLRAHGDDDLASSTLGTLAAELMSRYVEEAGDGWRWFEPTLTYDNAIMPLALFRAHSVTGEPEMLRIARESLGFLDEVCFGEGHLTLVGNAGWYSRGGERPVADEQPIDAAAFVLAYRGAYVATGDHRYLKRMRESLEWFLGANRLGLPLYDFSTAGCRDGLEAHGANDNEGAESTISFLLALLTVLDVAGEGLDHPIEGMSRPGDPLSVSVESQSQAVEERS